MASAEDAAAEEYRVAELVRVIRAGGDLSPLIPALRGSDDGLDSARGVLLTLGELDLDLLVQMVIDTLIATVLEETPDET